MYYGIIIALIVKWVLDCAYYIDCACMMMQHSKRRRLIEHDYKQAAPASTELGLVILVCKQHTVLT